MSIAAVKLFLGKNWTWLALGALLAAMLTVSYCKGQSAGKSGEVIKQQEREIDVQASVSVAHDTAADQRVLDVIELTKQEQELKDAASHATGSADARRRRGCVILRQQGRDTSRLPECRGS